MQKPWCASNPPSHHRSFAINKPCSPNYYHRRIEGTIRSFIKSIKVPSISPYLHFVSPYEKMCSQNRRSAGRVGWRHKAYAGAHRVVAYPPQHKEIDSSTLHEKIFLVGWLFQCSDRARYSDANPPYKDIVFMCKSIEQIAASLCFSQDGIPKNYHSTLYLSVGAFLAPYQAGLLEGVHHVRTTYRFFQTIFPPAGVCCPVTNHHPLPDQKTS